MMETLLSEPILAMIGPTLGQVFRHIAEGRKAQREWVLTALQASDASRDAAAKRSGPGGVWMRRALYGLIAFVFVSVIAAGFLGVPVVVEQEVSKGILFWQKTVSEFITIDGVLFPPEIRKAFILFIGFYLGQGVK